MTQNSILAYFANIGWQETTWSKNVQIKRCVKNGILHFRRMNMPKQCTDYDKFLTFDPETVDVDPPLFVATSESCTNRCAWVAFLAEKKFGYKFFLEIKSGTGKRQFEKYDTFTLAVFLWCSTRLISCNWISIAALDGKMCIELSTALLLREKLFGTIYKDCM